MPNRPPPEERLKDAFAARLRAARQEVGLGREQLAKGAEMQPAQLWIIEDGANPTLLTLLRLAGSLGTDVGTLLKGFKWDPPAGQRHGRFRLPHDRPT